MGAQVFHGPVRDGKEWDHLAMGTRRNWCAAMSSMVDRAFRSTELEEVNGVIVVANCYGPLKVIGSSLTSN